MIHYIINELPSLTFCDFVFVQFSSLFLGISIFKHEFASMSVLTSQNLAK